MNPIHLLPCAPGRGVLRLDARSRTHGWRSSRWFSCRLASRLAFASIVALAVSTSSRGAHAEDGALEVPVDPPAEVTVDASGGLDPDDDVDDDDELELPPGMDPRAFAGMSLEDLTRIEVYSASKRAQSLGRVPAAVFVLTQEDIRRSGVTTIPDALRLVPGINVARLDANKWAISSRGFNDRFAMKLLVLIDGRSVYTPLFAGVFWETIDTYLDDVERIEVIRGPGGTVWGANAVNGVINIITKPAAETQGPHAYIGGGTEERAFVGGRFGARFAESGGFRVWAKAFERDSGYRGHDDWGGLRAGFRLDWTPTWADTITSLGGMYAVEVGVDETIPTFTAPFSERVIDDTEFTGGYLLERWEHQTDDLGDVSLQLYWDHTELRTERVAERRDTFDIEFQHDLSICDAHALSWGLGYRASIDAIRNTDTLVFDPESRDIHLVSCFVQDEWSAIENVLTLTAGTKLEYHTLSGVEVLPSGRVSWQPADRHSLWGAVSQAVRVSSRADDDIRLVQDRIPTSPATGIYPLVTGTGDSDSEELLAFEIGYRVQPIERLSMDIAAFYNRYDDLTTLEPGTPFVTAQLSPGDVFLPLLFDDKMDGETYGVELASTWQPIDWLRVSLGYSFLRVALHADSSSAATSPEASERDSPRNQGVLRMWFDLPWDLELDVGVRYVDSLGSLATPSYLAADLRLGWKAPIDGQNLRIDLVAQNLFDDKHPEFMSRGIATAPTETQHGVFAKLTWTLE